MIPSTPLSITPLPPTENYPKAFNVNSLIKERLTTTFIKTAAVLPPILWLNYVFIFFT